MFLVIVLCMKLFVLHTSVCEEYHCSVDGNNDVEIQLMQNTGKFSRIYDDLNGYFNRKCQYNYKISVLKINDTKFLNTLKQVNTQKYVINLYVPDYYDYYEYDKPDKYNEMYRNIVYAGDINNYNTTDQKYCIASNTGKQPKDYYSKWEGGKNINTRVPFVKVVSNDVSKINSEDLYHFVTSIQFVNGVVNSRESCYTVYENATELKTILLCLDEEPDNNIVIDIYPLKLVIIKTKNIDDCKSKLRRYNDNFLAVLAPTPFKNDTDYNLVPVIFYKTPYLSLEDDEYFVNSVTLLPWQLLKYVYLEFLRSMDWHRVVIFTDNSTYSIDFEYELTQLFNEEKIVYAVLRCKEGDCNMAEAQKRLSGVGATIVIANVNEENAKSLLNLEYKQEIIWLVRDLSMYAHRYYREPFVFSFTLDSTRYKRQRCYYNDLILDGISRISRAYRHLNSADSVIKKPDFYRKLAEQIRKEKPETDKVMGFVHRVSNPDDILLEVLINKDGVEEVLHFTSPFNIKISDGVNCAIRSYDYFNPCEDVLIILLMFVIILFATTLLLITCFYTK